MNIWVYKRGRTLNIFSEYSSVSFPSFIAHEFSAKLPSGSCRCRPQRHPFLDEPGFSGECPLQLLGRPLPISGVCIACGHYGEIAHPITQSTVAQNGQTVTTMWRTLRPNKEDRVAKLEWSANGGLGRVVMGKVGLAFIVQEEPPFFISFIP